MSIFILIFLFVLGLIIGSFLDCLAWRLYKGESLLNRSYCPQCRHQIAWYDNIPLLSFLILRGRCRHCRRPISWQYPAIELVTGLLFILAGVKELGGWHYFLAYTPEDLFFQFSSVRWLLSTVRDLLVISTLVLIFIYDGRWYLISNLIICSTAVAVFLLNLSLGFAWYHSLLFAIISSGFFFLQFILTRRRGLGEGDIWLGFWLGLVFPDLSLWWLMILIAYFSGSLTGLFLMIVGRKKWGSKLPLGVFLAFSAVIVLLYGQALIAYYQSWFF